MGKSHIALGTRDNRREAKAIKAMGTAVFVNGISIDSMLWYEGLLA